MCIPIYTCGPSCSPKTMWQALYHLLFLFSSSFLFPFVTLTLGARAPFSRRRQISGRRKRNFGAQIPGTNQSRGLSSRSEVAVKLGLFGNRSFDERSHEAPRPVCGREFAYHRHVRKHDISFYLLCCAIITARPLPLASFFLFCCFWFLNIFRSPSTLVFRLDPPFLGIQN